MTMGSDAYSIVALDRFIQATRDSGYKGTSSAVSELVDNSIQAGATSIEIEIGMTDDPAVYPLVVTILDNGEGMTPDVLRTALRFGGSSRFNDRSGLGRYGMGLPNSSLSQARRVTVRSWTSPGSVVASYLDVDEIAAGAMRAVPAPLRDETFTPPTSSGTCVTWTRCDRLDNRRPSTIIRKLHAALGRRFRHYLWDSVAIRLNGELVEPLDPLFLDERARHAGATRYGEVIEYEVGATVGGVATSGVVRVTFSELPVASWSKLPNKQKRAMGISKGAGVSVVRGQREVDYGWFFMGRKRRENYDDWWRCEIAFDPVLDEEFGITHTKQQIRPKRELLEALVPDIEATARALSARARRAHLEAKLSTRFTESEEIARSRDELLRPLPEAPPTGDPRLVDALKSRLAPGQGAAAGAKDVSYRIIPKALQERTFFDVARDAGTLALLLNPEHPFYRYVYKPLLESERPQDSRVRVQVDLLLLALARTEASLEDAEQASMAAGLRRGWSDTLATFLNE